MFADYDLNDPYDIPTCFINTTENGVCLFKDMTEWLKSAFEDNSIVITKSKSTAAMTSAMIRKEKQIIARATNQHACTMIEIPISNESQSQTSSLINDLEHLGIFHDT
ncbi:hypothetical protein I4U23_007402 [Adineta vaga]|nr:hypothetical protein I4U23_007402 [Adineta vaga]